MRVAALSLAGLKMDPREDYIAYLSALLEESQVELAALPAYTGFLLWMKAGHLAESCGFIEGFQHFMQAANQWNEAFLQLHSDLASDNNTYLVTGTTVEEANGRFYQTAYCFDPRGEVCGRQRQTHLTREERALGLSRGDELQLMDVAGLRTGLIVGTDARHPEVGRILAIEGAELVAHVGCLIDGLETQVQPAGIWAQVQQNQFWAIEAQLGAPICDRSFRGQCAVMGPCEATPGLTGYLARAEANEPLVTAELVEADRQRIKKDYPLLRLLQPNAYVGLLPELYETDTENR
ncbi:MAG: hypothetical protein GX998_04610 [Firmicutes bacterium]|nr:hypothetical protein [Bacillota bacterium]